MYRRHSHDHGHVQRKYHGPLLPSPPSPLLPSASLGAGGQEGANDYGMTMDMYKENILDHYKKPRNFGELPSANAKAHATNPLCGDELDFALLFDAAGKVAEVKFTGRGCTITIASASMLSEKLKGMPRGAIKDMTTEEAVQLLGVPVNPARLKCATLALETVQKAIGHH